MDTNGDDDNDPVTGTAVDSTSPAGATAGPSQPRPIRMLTQDVVNRIAAAEIIHRPSNAVKELLENALDAGATSIRVSVKEGGLKLLQITDNGHGINRADLPLLCERYATSKLEQFEDLQSLATYGFRGEALASISYCSHLEVVTKTRSDSCGWKAQYDSGELVSEPRPTAANDGTVISAEDLFYNMPLRKRAFRSASDEYGRILDVVTKYAVHNPQTAWVCKKAGTALSEVSTSAGSTSRANIALLYTSSLASELLEVPLTHFPPKLGASVHGWVSNANSNWARRGGWILFINNRLVESTKIKKAIDGLYTAFLARGASPFCYLSLHIDPAKVDVNVHPTKSEVHFLHEDEIVDAVVAAVDKALANANASRSFTVQTLLPGAEALRRRTADDSDDDDDDDDDDDSHGHRRPGPSSQSQRNSSSSSKPAPNYKVRIDPANRTLDSMVTIMHPGQISAYDERSSKRRGVGDGDDEVQLIDDDDDGDETPMWNATQPTAAAAESLSKEISESSCDFESVVELRRQVRKRASPELIETMSKHSFVGVVDRRSCLALIQHATKLMLVNYAALGDEHFYQLGLRQFGALGRLRLEPKPKLADLLRLAAEDEEHGIEANGLTVDTVVKKATALLLSKREMVDEYFSLSISASGAVESIPLLLKGYTPNLDRLPHFLLCLATRVDWTSEQECFETFLRELAFFYSPRPFDDNQEREAEEAAETSDEVAHDLWQLEHVVFPSLRRTQWPRTLSEHDVRQVANLPSLYRVFERC